MRALRVLGKAILTTVIFFLIVEAGLRAAYAGRNAFVRYVPLPYVVGDDYGPIPPWLDNLLILRPDPVLIWKNIPNARRAYVDIFTPVRADRDRLALLRRFLPWLPPEFRSNPVWRIALNGDGFRSAPFSADKPLGVLRIACIGDSWTFGMNVDQDKTYPARVEALLGRQTPPQRVEVMNFGTLGYSSYQGLQVLKTRALGLQPDVVIIGFGMNDSDVAGYRDRDVLKPSPPHWRDRVKAITSYSESLALMKYVALALRFQPKNLGEFLKADAKADQGKSNDTVNYDDMEAWTRVSPRDYEQNLREMIRLSRARQARVVLLDNELWPESPYRAVLRALSRDEHVPLVDSLQLIADERAKIERGLETGLHLSTASAAPAAPGVPVPAAAAGVPVVFRVSQGAYPVSTRLSIVGNHPALGAFSPNTIAMRDDGMSGDEHGGDRVWSYRAMLPAGARFRYVYTNSGAPGQWEGLDLPHVREVLVAAQPGGGPMYLPVETFGRIYMQADNWHTDAAGYELIAKAIVEALR